MLTQNHIKRTFDHADIVRAVADRQRHRALVELDQFDNLRFLQRSDSTADDGPAHTTRLQQKRLILLRQRMCLQPNTQHSCKEPRSRCT